MGKNQIGLTVLCGLIAGCVAPEPVEEPTAEIAQPIESCPWAVCSNSPEIAHYGLWEASLFGQRDTRGQSLKTWRGQAALKKGSLTYQMSVIDGRISGVNGNGSISGSNLVDAEMEVVDSAGQTLYLITITAVRSTAVTFAVGAPDFVEVYTMRWSPPVIPGQINKSSPLCNAVLPSTSDNKEFELMGMRPEETLVFEGDRIDAEKKNMSATADDSWFNFGCAGHTLAKLYLTRNTIHSQPVDDWDQRQATLKMLTADYCGHGTAFTLAGEPIAWKGGLQLNYPPTAQITTIDARWHAGGATCLGDPRIRSSSNPDAAIQFPDVIKEIHDQCPSLPTCSDQDTASLDGARIISVNRQP